MTDPLSKLPMFAADREIAVAIVGKERVAVFVKAVIPQLERKGFPRIDPLHDGRPVPLVRKFYDGYFGITAGFVATASDDEERLGEWKKRRAHQTSRCQGKEKKVIDEDSPRLIGRKEAAAYCGIAESTFSMWVATHKMPPCIPGTRKWDRRAIDAKLDEISGLTAVDSEDPYEKWMRENP